MKCCLENVRITECGYYSPFATRADKGHNTCKGAGTGTSNSAQLKLVILERISLVLIYGIII